ncbi:PqqD family protein [Mesorhizobium sp. 1B3]|uniref:PqqD family protein n=1 Tax=Mesorhizobium sp. 1B3 TaxID=3243599 RepID=UPI003D996020
MGADFAEDLLIRANSDVVFCELGGELALLDLHSNTYYGLNKVGARIWELIQEPRSVSQLCEAIVEMYDVDPARCRVDVEALVTHLARVRLIGLSNEGAA